MDQQQTEQRRQGWAWLLLLLTLAAWLAPPLLSGKVLYSSDNRAETAGGFPPPKPIDLWYLDVATLYVPETAAHLEGDHEAWLASWNPHNELGRPLFQAGSGPGFLLFRALSWFTRDPYVHTTWMSALALALTGIFAMGFLLDLGLRPLAAYAGAVALSVGPMYPAWAMSHMVQAGYCWAFGSLWCLQHWFRGGSRWSLAGLAFCVHAILLTGFLQHVLGLGWIVGLWVLARCAGFGSPQRRGLRALGQVCAATLAGVACSLPCFLDLFLVWRDSSRAAFDFEWEAIFYSIDVRKLPRATLADGVGPACYSLGLIYTALTLIGLFSLRRREARYWAGWAALVVLGCGYLPFFSIFTAMGMSFSAWSPIYLLHVPAAILAGFGADGLLRLGSRWKLPRALPAAALTALVLLASYQGRNDLVVWQDREAIATESRVAKTLRRKTADGSRFAIVGKRPGVSHWLPPNLEMVLGIHSLHSYFHVPSQAFHDWVLPLRAADERVDFDRRFFHIHGVEALSPEHLSLAGLSTLVSFEPLPPELVGKARRVGRVHIADLHEPGPLQALLPWDTIDERRDLDITIDPAHVPRHAIQGRRKTGVHDRLELHWNPQSDDRVLFLSQQYHPLWSASSDGQALSTLRINGLFQGVLVPAGVQEVQLRYEPYARWMTWVQGAFGLALLGWTFSLLRSFRRRRARLR